ncbi:hypothetical protein Tco_1493244 [Tanacetum coccineum]
MMEADYELAQRLQAEEQGELTIEERSKLFVELMDKRNNTLQSLELKRSKENHQPKPKRGIKCVEGSKKRTREELESDNSKKQKIDENVETEVDDEAEMKKHMEIVPDDEVAIKSITTDPLSPAINVDRKIIKEGKMGYF